MNKQGKISGAEAVGFFSRSKLPVQALREIWTVAESSKTNALNKRDFFVAVRLIQLYQNNVKGEGMNLQVGAGVSLKAPYFEGFAAPAPAPTPVSAPAPVMNAFPGNNSFALTTDPYIMSPSDEGAFKQLFPNYIDADTKKVPGNVAVQLFTKSGVDTSLLRNIWAMSDADKDNFLSEKEFCVAMHLIVCVSKKGLPLPGTLPGSLAAYLNGGKPASISASQQEQQRSVPPIQIPSQQQHANQPLSLPSPTSLPPSYMQQQPPVQQQIPQYTNPPPLQQTHQQAVPEDKFSAFDDIDNSTIHSHMSVGNTPKEAFQSLPVVHEPPTIASAPAMPSVGNYGMETMANSSASVSSFHKPPVTTVSYTSPAPVSVSIPEPEVNVRSSSPTPVVSNAKNFAISGNSDEQLQSLITKLQAENISLKAKLSMYSGEETSIAEEKTKLLVDIAALLERAGVLREQCAEKREAIASGKTEIKALQEKKELLKETILTKETELEWLNNANIPQPEPETMDLFSSDPVTIHPPAVTNVTAPVIEPETSPFENVQGPAPASEGLVVSNAASVPTEPIMSTYNPPVILPPAEPTAEEVNRLENLREATVKIGERKDEAEVKLKELKQKHEEAENMARVAEEEVNETMNTKSKGFGGKKKKAKELESLQSKAALERQKAYEAAHAAKLTEEAVRTLEAELEAAQVELASFESIVQANVEQRKVRNSYSCHQRDLHF